MIEDPDWPRASAWLAGSGAQATEGGSASGSRDGAPAGAPTLAVLGAPVSRASISPSSAHTTPAAIRAALRRFSTWCAPVAVDLAGVRVTDLGDLAVADLELQRANDVIAAAVGAVEADLLVVLGGDNSVTRPALRGRVPVLAEAGLLTLDAHHDVRGFHAGPTNGTPVRGLIADGLPGGNVVQVGIGAFTNSPAHARWCAEQGITVVGLDAAVSEGVAACVTRHLDALTARCTGIWVDLDVDVLDAAFAPGCPGARPGGMTPAQLHAAAFAAGAHPAVVGIDVVEVDAAADPTGTTVDNAALCLLHAAAGLAVRVR